MPLTVPSTLPRQAALFLAGLSGAAGLALAWHYPLAPMPALLLWLGMAGLAFARWQVLPWLLPGLLPLLGFAPWTGWISFEEMDLLVLAAATGGYTALALGAGAAERAPAWQRPLVWSALARLLLTLFAASLLVAMWRGIEDAGGWRFGWWQGYHEPMNSLRQGKSFFLVLLLLPLWRATAARRPAAVQRLFGLAMLVALALASLGAIWERLAFTDLLNFSADYRTTSLFWEMHVGGAALDGCLALTLPFALWALLRLRRPLQFGAALLLVLLAGYAILTTFSRGLYLGAPMGAGLCLFLLARQRRSHDAAPLWPDWGGGQRLAAALLFLAFAFAAWPMFRWGGYRALLALLGCALLFVSMPPVLVRQSRVQRLMMLLLSLLMASLAGALTWAISMAWPKSAYLIYTLALACGLALVWWRRAGLTRQLHACLLAAIWFWTLACAVVVAGYWGGDGALSGTWVPVLVWAALWVGLQASLVSGAQVLSGLGWRARTVLWLACLPVAGIVTALGAGDYVSERMSTGRGDLAERVIHWRLGLGMLDGAQDWLLGKGVGRFASSYLLEGPDAERVGDYRWTEQAGQGYLTLTGGKHLLGWGELLRVSQRMEAPQGDVLLRIRLRADQDLGLHAEICEKHLLYSGACLSNELAVKSQPGVWQQLSLPLGKADPMGGNWWAPRLISFSVGLASNAARVDIAELHVTDVRQQELLGNSDFQHGMTRWFFSSDRYHQPWHMKSMPLHVLFEQGLVGLLLWSGLLLAALWRCSLGHARQHALAPAVAGSLLGFLAVGAFDSLIDVPRIAFLFYAVLVLGLGLRALPPPKA